MTKLQLIEQILNRKHITTEQLAVVVEGIFESLEESLAKGEKIEVEGLGNLEVREFLSLKTPIEITTDGKRPIFHQIKHYMDEGKSQVVQK